MSAQGSGEFALIGSYFRNLTGQRGVALGIGDDAALLCGEQLAGQQLVVASDTLVAGVHFPVDTNPFDIATRALCVNISDMAAMGAEPRWFTLALTLPPELASDSWLGQFSRGLAEVAAEFDCALIGGDTTSGALTITLTLLGTVPTGQALCRAGARPGDLVYVSGCLGDGAAALYLMTSPAPSEKIESERLLSRFNRPIPQVQAGIELRSLASACIDISDGLLADLGHICKESGVGAQIEATQIPVHQDVRTLDSERCLNWALSGGDDYQLCFTLPEAHRAQLQARIDDGRIEAHCIGHITGGDRLEVLDESGAPLAITGNGYDHFAR